jgi:choline dehydrogenase
VTGGEHGFNGWLTTERAKLTTIADAVVESYAATVKKDLWLRDPLLTAILISTVKTTLDDLTESSGEARERVREKVLAYLLKKDINHMDSIKNRPEGLYFTPLATNNGRRASVRDRIRAVQQVCPNRLIVKTQVLVTKVVLQKDAASSGKPQFTAVGVECREGAHLYRADPKAADTSPPAKQFKAKREVIISGGAFNTPQLLMLSGIGPRKELQRHGIPVNIDLSGVGKNLQDRYEVGIVYKMKDNFTILEGATFTENDEQYRQWKDADPKARKEGKGFLYSSNGVVIAILKRSSVAKSANENPDLFIFGLPSDFRGYEQGYTKSITIKDRFTWLVLKAHTRNSGGEVTLRSNDPRDTPQINFKYFEEGNDTNKGQEDLQAMLEAVAFIRQIMKRLSDDGQAEEIWPGPQVTDNALREWIMNEAWGHHASCSCKLGADGDVTAVLDKDFRVRGTANLRVVDASIFPYIPGFFIVTPVYMIAEKASEVILAEAKQSST